MFEVRKVAEVVNDALQTCESLFNQGKFKELEIVSKQVLKVNPENARAYQFLGLSYYQQQQYIEALFVFQELINKEPKQAENYNNLALCHSCLGEFDAAIEYLQIANQLDPESSVYLNNLGFQYRRKRLPNEAIPYFEQAIKINPKEAHIYSNLAGAYGELNEIAIAIQELEKARELEPENNAVKVDLAYSYFLNGQWEKAWNFYEARHLHYPQVKKMEIKYPPNHRWKGQDISGKRLVVYCEQGIGDMIQFLRYLPIVEKQFKPTFWIDSPQELHSILNSMGYVGFTGNVEYDFHCSIVSLPYILGMTSEKDIPNNPYIKPCKRKTLSKEIKLFNVGIAWGGNPQHPKDRFRSCFLKEFYILEDIEEVALFSLQKDLRKRIWPPSKEIVDLTENTAGMKLTNLGNLINDFSDTADFIADLDLVITVDTAILHLAGAMGAQVWGLIPFNPDWRWKLDGESSIWYPSLRLFRQKKQENWKDVFVEVKSALQHHICSKYS